MFRTVTQILPQFDDGKFWMFSEGGRKFIGLEKNSHVCLAIYDKYDGFGNLRSLQVTGDGRAFLGGVQRPCCFQEDPAGRSEKTALTDESNLRDAYPHRCSVLRFQEGRLQQPTGPASACVNSIVKLTNRDLQISFCLEKGLEVSVLQFFRNSGFHQQRHGTAQFIFHSGNPQHLCRGSLSYSLVWSGFTGCIELLMASKMV